MRPAIPPLDALNRALPTVRTTDATGVIQGPATPAVKAFTEQTQLSTMVYDDQPDMVLTATWAEIRAVPRPQ